MKISPLNSAERESDDWSWERLKLLSSVSFVRQRSSVCVIVTEKMVSSSSLSIFPLPSWSNSLKYHFSFWLISPFSIRLMAAMYSTKSMYPSCRQERETVTRPFRSLWTCVLTFSCLFLIWKLQSMFYIMSPVSAACVQTTFRLKLRSSILC